MADASLESAKASQAILERDFGGKPGVLGIGLGKGEAGDGYVLRVYVRSKSVARSLPKTIGETDVVPELTGAISAY